MRVPSLIVVKSELRSPASAIERVELGGRQGFTDMDDLDRFVPIEGVELPETPAYEVIDIDTGSDTRNVTPDDALEAIRADGRTPLTIDEGICAGDPAA